MKKIKYNKVGDYEFPSLKQERPIPNIKKYNRRIKETRSNEVGEGNE